MLQTLITLDFGASSITIGRDLYGARVVDGGDGSGPSVTVSLLPLKQCLGMYKDPSCNNAFGFTGVAEPPLRALPTVSCVLTRDLPMPPPPQPPMMPPSPPPGYAIDVSQCYLGGHAHFVVAPHKVSSTAALQTWVVNVHLNLWRAGMNVVLDFPGALHATHSLHVASVTPADVARLVSVTKHSAIVQLQETAARDFKFEALGDVDSVTVCLLYTSPSPRDS